VVLSRTACQASLPPGPPAARSPARLRRPAPSDHAGSWLPRAPNPCVTTAAPSSPPCR